MKDFDKDDQNQTKDKTITGVPKSNNSNGWLSCTLLLCKAIGLFGATGHRFRTGEQSLSRRAPCSKQIPH